MLWVLKRTCSNFCLSEPIAIVLVFMLFFQILGLCSRLERANSLTTCQTNSGSAMIVYSRLLVEMSTQHLLQVYYIRASDFFQDWWAVVTHGAKNGGSFSEMMAPSISN